MLHHALTLGQVLGPVDREKLIQAFCPSTPICLRYHGSLADAVDDLGKPEEIGKAFVGFQKYLYQEAATIRSSPLPDIVPQKFHRYCTRNPSGLVFPVTRFSV